MLSILIFTTLWGLSTAVTLDLDVYDEEACGVNKPRYIHVDAEGLISSPNFNLSHPDTYPPNSLCEWLINQTSSHGLELKFLNMSLEVSEQCKSDYVQVFQKGDPEDDLLGTYCGDQVPPAIVLQSPATLLVRFVSDATVEYAGFVARYGFPIDDRECINSVQAQQINATTGMIYSPNWPQDYDNLINCRWLFTAQENYVFDGNSAEAPRFGAWYGENTTPPTIHTTGPHMFIRFLTDFDDTFQGFLGFFAQVEANKEEWKIL